MAMGGTSTPLGMEGAMEPLLGKKTIEVVASLLSLDHVVFDMHWLHS
jgi:hypothetical protein